MTDHDDILDCLIVGAGPGGLTVTHPYFDRTPYL